MARVELRALSKVFEDGAVAVDGLDLTVEHGELCALLGPSGCGKTTVVRLVAGLDKPTEGTVTIGGLPTAGVPARRRGVSLVKQEAALYPHLTAGDNMAFPLRVRRKERAEIDRRVDDMATALGVKSHLVRRPAELSAGHRQGVATGRALLGGSEVLLMDEPMSNLDASAKVKLHADLLSLKAQRTTTILYVTNDQAEAMSLADQIAVLDGGRLQQAAAPEVVYSDPANLMVAGFVGLPAMNLVLAEVAEGKGGMELRLGSRRFSLTSAWLAGRPRLGSFVGDRVVVGIRPEHLRFGAGARAAVEQPFGGEVVHTEFAGRNLFAHFVNDALDRGGTPGAEFVATLPGDARVGIGDHIGLAVDLDRVHVFDPADGVSLRAPEVTARETSS